MPFDAVSVPMARARMRRAAKREAAEAASTPTEEVTPSPELAEVFESLTAG